MHFFMLRFCNEKPSAHVSELQCKVYELQDKLRTEPPVIRAVFSLPSVRNHCLLLGVIRKIYSNLCLQIGVKTLKYMGVEGETGMSQV